MAQFIPPINGGVFRPSSADISSWLYQIWKYLQENPIANEEELTEIINQTMPDAVATYLEENPVEVDYPVTSVNGKTGTVNIEYAELVDGTTLPIYRAANDEVGQNDLLEAYSEGCRFAVVDDTNTFVLLKNGTTITMLPIGGSGSSGSGDGILSINGNIYPDANGNAIVTGANLPMASSSSTTIKSAIEALPTLTQIVNTIYPVGAIYLSTVNTSPATLFPNTTWQQIEDRFLLAAGSNYTAGDTGGEATHTLTIAEMPSHTHQTDNAPRYNPLTYVDSDGLVYVATSGNKKMKTSDILATGGDQPHNNMPPYLVVYMWQRTA